MEAVVKTIKVENKQSKEVKEVEEDECIMMKVNKERIKTRLVTKKS
jgi:hypothetical protein